MVPTVDKRDMKANGFEVICMSKNSRDGINAALKKAMAWGASVVCHVDLRRFVNTDKDGKGKTALVDGDVYRRHGIRLQIV